MVPKTNAQRLVGMARDMGAAILQGTVSRDSWGWKMGEASLDAWLEKHEGQECVLVAVVIEAEAEPPKTCRVCGRDYTGEACPYCREARRRLRGE